MNLWLKGISNATDKGTQSAFDSPAIEWGHPVDPSIDSLCEHKASCGRRAERFARRRRWSAPSPAILARFECMMLRRCWPLIGQNARTPRRAQPSIEALSYTISIELRVLRSIEGSLRAFNSLAFLMDSPKPFRRAPMADA